MPNDGGVLRCADDGLYLPTIKPHSLEKIALHNRYAERFASAMHRKWPQLAYIGLYAGAGRALVVEKGVGTAQKEIVETSALAVLRQPKLFTHYIYVDNDDRCTTALRQRIDALHPSSQVTVFSCDVNDCVSSVRNSLPRFTKTHGLLSFCFIDPFDLQLRFSTIRALSDLKIDFLVLLMLGVDARRNLRSYYDSDSTRIADFVDCPDWRSEHPQGSSGVVRFLARKFDEGMVRLGYLSAKDTLHPVKVKGMSVFQYFLAFYSKDQLGMRFWQDCRQELSPQLGFDFSDSR